MSTSFDGVLPAALEGLRARDWQPITLGQSEAAVWRIAGGGETLFLKTTPRHDLSELPGEAARLAWLADTPIPAPAIRDYIEADSAFWLLTTALPGRDLTTLVQQPVDLRNALASGLRALHDLDPATCPFDQRLDAKLAEGAANVAAGRVDETDFDTARAGWTATGVLDWVHRHRPAETDLVVAHGDASLPNILSQGAAFGGVVDCGRLGVADRWQDLAIACRSIIFNCGPDHVAPFLEEYGAVWDEERYRYYCTLDELF